jgi:xanthine dehydrogenase YagS FAD-binding subunit
MKNFTYYRPKTAKEAVALLDAQWGTSELLAGGTDLLDLQKEYIAQPDKVVSIGGITDLGSIGLKHLNAIEVQPEGSLRIGAGATLAAIAENEQIRTRYPALATAAGQIGGPQIRNMGTLGGNLCQRNRCWYFRDEHVNCLLKGGDKCFAINGDNRYHAVFAKGHKCVIVHPSTLAPVLIALGAEVEPLRSPNTRGLLSVAKFFRAPSGPSDREHVLEPNAMILSVRIPFTSNHLSHSASYEVRHKQSYDWPLVQAAVAFQLDAGKAKDVRIVLGHVAPTPHVAEDAARALEGKAITEETAAAAGEAATKGASPLSQNGYKVKLITVAVKRALLTAAGAKKYWEA